MVGNNNKNTISAIDHIITNSIINNKFKTPIVTADIPFPNNLRF